ncbi:Lymphocyte antigen 6L [Vulpes lagopus]|uniref:lymphocyte antigen 6L n=1 Tax=Vulpes lagopus TaxID=494514 RepID=UPI001BC98F82|nr:lymphocyte antigen 6L [Vulpes lagopus]
MRAGAAVLCALLLSAGLGGGEEPRGRGAGGGGAGPSAAAPPAPPGLRAGGNLSCYQCFKVSGPARCAPAACHPADRVCVSHAVTFRSQTQVTTMLSKRCAPRCPNTNMKYDWILGPRILGSIVRQCCSGFLCNRAPATLEGPWALPRGFLLGVGLLWVLL